jgi:hypothetical protein
MRAFSLSTLAFSATIGCLIGVFDPVVSRCADDLAATAPVKSSDFNGSTASTDQWHSFALLKREMEAALLNGNFVVAKEKQALVVEFATKHFGEHHWTTRESQLTLNTSSGSVSLPTRIKLTRNRRLAN